MTITADQAKRIETFQTVHEQVLDNELLCMVMQSLVTVRIISESWTGQPKFFCELTKKGLASIQEFECRAATNHD